MGTSSTCAENLVLIGFMGAGKSTVGRLLARKTGRPFLDTDALIESTVGMPVPEIFESRGEAFFREKERETARWIAECVRGCILSTGGGFPESAEDPKRLGIVVYLKLEWEAVLRRVGEEERSRRPLFRDLETAKKLYETRRALYEKMAQIVVDADRPPKAVAEAVLAAVKNEK